MIWPLDQRLNVKRVKDDMDRITAWPTLPKLTDITSSSGVVDFSHEYSLDLTKDQMRYIIEQNETEIVDFTYSERDCYDYGKHRKLAKFKRRKGESSL